MTPKYVGQHASIGHENTPRDTYYVGIFGSVYDIPVEGESFDAALGATVPECLKEPNGITIKCGCRVFPSSHTMRSGNLRCTVHIVRL